MRKITLLHLSFFITLLLSNLVQGNAQSISAQVIGASGGSISSGAGSVSFTAGEAVVGPAINSESINQGFWNGAAAGATLSLQNTPQGLSILAYPNPITEEIYIQMDQPKAYSATLINLSGKQVLQKNTSEGLFRMDTSGISSGVYVLQLRFRESDQINTFKIIKK